MIYVIPKGYCLDFNTIWRKQELYPSLVFELENLAHATFNYVQSLSGNGMEHLKKEETWKNYRDEKYQLSRNFLNDLINKELIDSQSRSETKDNKQSKKIDIEIEIVNLGGKYWEKLNKGWKDIFYLLQSLICLILQLELKRQVEYLHLSKPNIYGKLDKN